MKKFMNRFIRRKEVLSAVMVMGGLVSVLAKYGCCFYIYHQPRFPEALRDTNE